MEDLIINYSRMVYAVIMAGGVGTRFWPKSRKSNPKQFLNLFGETSMIQQTAERLQGFVEEKQVVVVTNKDYVSLVEKQLPSIEPMNIIGEPVARNTAPCIASAAALLNKKDPESVMIVLPADHRIGSPNEFKRVLETAVETAKTQESLVTIGIKPNRPETGYGYIHRESDIEMKNLNHPVYRVQEFTEKPDQETAQDFFESGDYLWNSGIFIWKTSTILDAFKKHLPKIFTESEKLKKSDFKTEDVRRFYEACPPISIDYGIMEKAEKVHVIPGDFDWNDVGSWTAVHELSDKESEENSTVKGKAVYVNSSGNYISTNGKKLVAFAGVDNVALVETDDAILVVNLDQAQDVKEIVEKLKENEDTKKYL
ncbi:mannose-1-phosphate guanylyltransferase [Rhodohalobacter sulfatireducens]|uniref:NTP transferase domain-containing protein n=1 Tax=Rhodohalobacter sulfatireducens TaxID=2911366 RepID=A0ABS9K8K1_9BACT|nr:mannose-1-phosphate guanylyltransferase [Rhodohalobacter sulfatireducens]MCG2587192.1 NTP transferase domain-containing protein [Rhodohalobacter sulfatireducens]